MTTNINSKVAMILGVLTLTTTAFAANPLKGNPFIDASTFVFNTDNDNGDHGPGHGHRPPGHGGDQDQDCGKGDQDCHDKPHRPDKPDCGKGDQDCKPPECDKGDQDCQDQDGDTQAMRVDCRYRSNEATGPKFCYASAIYTPVAGDKVTYTDVQLGVGCDQQTIYNNDGRVHTETVSERISPSTAAFPAVEIFPQGALLQTGTYESVLEIRQGRIGGLCYVHPIE